jgi:hypothetical protein
VVRGPAVSGRMASGTKYPPLKKIFLSSSKDGKVFCPSHHLEVFIFLGRKKNKNFLG